jgi:sulfate adenylyltransferase subunit 2
VTTDRLSRLEAESVYVIREARARFTNLALLWSIGKDSTTLLWLCRKAFFGEIPFPVVHIDTTFKFPEMYAFRDEWARRWNLDLKIARNDDALSRGVSYETHDALTCCDQLKTVALKQAIAREGYDALLVGIRRDEHGVRAKERFFSPRDDAFRWNYEDQPAELWDHYHTGREEGDHFRVHPLLGWTEIDVWRYTQREGLPVNELYFSRGGLRYRSLGCMPITKPMPSEARTIGAIVDELESTDVSERSGRAQDKEELDTMQKLRALGYM